MECISYKKKVRYVKYQLSEEYSTDITIKPPVKRESSGNYVTLSTEGQIVIKKGYAWDGPSGPTIDTLNFMRGSLVHDALYQLMREGKLKKTHRKSADKLLRKMCKEDGMSSIRASWVYYAVRMFGKKHTKSGKSESVVKAPKECQ